MVNKTLRKIFEEELQNAGPRTVEKFFPGTVGYKGTIHPNIDPVRVVRKNTKKGEMMERMYQQNDVHFSEFSFIDDQTRGKYLKGMILSDLVERPRRGVYRLTPQGKTVYKKVKQEGVWRL